MNHSKKSSRRKRRESIDRPPKAHNAAPRRGWLIVIGAALCVVVAVVLIQWDSSRRSGPQTFTGNSIETQAPGAPPVDAAAVLQLASSIPGTVETLKAEATLTATRLTESFAQRPEAFAQLALLQSESGLNDEALVSWNAAKQRDAQFGAAYLGMGIIRAGRAEYARAATLNRPSPLLANLCADFLSWRTATSGWGKRCCKKVIIRPQNRAIRK